MTISVCAVACACVMHGSSISPVRREISVSQRDIRKPEIGAHGGALLTRVDRWLG